MAITDPLILPPDVLLTRVADLPEAVRTKMDCQPDDYVITRTSVRAASTIIDEPAAALLAEFRVRSTVAEALLRHSHKRGVDPARTLEQAFPLLTGLVGAEILVAHSEESPDADLMRPGAMVAGCRVLSLVAVLEDSAVAQVRTGDGGVAALKIARSRAAARMAPRLAREAAIYARLPEASFARLLAHGEELGHPFLLLSWCPGVSAQAAADPLREARDRTGLLALAVAVARAYARLHELGIVHGDVHPGNVLIDAAGAARLIDFGFSRLAGGDDSEPELVACPERAGVGFYFEPEYARAVLARHAPPPPSFTGEQYAVAALLYKLFTGAYALDFSLEADKMMRQIAADPPLPFVAQGVPPWPEVERVLERALAKDPEARFASVAELADGLAAVTGSAGTSASSAAPHGAPLMQVVEGFLRRVSPGGDLYESGLRQPPLSSINLGAAGLAYALYRIAAARDEPRLLALADVWLARARRDGAAGQGFKYPSEAGNIDIGTVSPYLTATGLHCVQALLALSMGDLRTASEAASAFAEAAGQPTDALDFTQGLAGVVLGATLLVEAQPAWTQLVDLGAGALRRIWERLDTYGEIGRAPELPTLGIAHGWGGLLYVTLRWSEATGAPLPAATRARVEQLAALAEPFGRGQRFRRDLGPGAQHSGADYMPGWCGGAAGLVHLFTAAHRAFGDPRHLTLAEGCAWFAYEHADTHPDLCCGLGGRAYALLALHRQTREASWLRRAAELTARAAAIIERRSVRPESLSCGVFGIAVLATDVEQPDFAARPFFESEGWPSAARSASQR